MGEGKPDASLVSVKLEGKALEKLVDVLARGAGILYEPTYRRRLAKAESDVALIKAESEQALSSLRDRASARVDAKKLRQQRNIEKILDATEYYLPEDVTQEPVDEDWVAQFFEGCQDISNEKLQHVWAKLLAGEVTKPGTFCPRTLATMRTLTQHDAELFETTCKFMIKGIGYLYTEHIKTIAASHGVTYGTFLHLESLGLLQCGTMINYTVKAGIPFTIVHNGVRHVFSKVTEWRVDCYPLTQMGRELSMLCSGPADEEYFTALIEGLEQLGANHSVIGVDTVQET